ncbi:MAG: hypothetical protein MI975_02365 [Cytophagales bacterium]|nr:hypothetical protein [Cytophagales bacterium]
MRLSIYTYWSFLVILFLVGCKEKHEVKPATFSLMLTGEESKSWRQSSFTFIFNDEEVDDINANVIYGIPDCALDDEYIFFRDGKQLEVRDGNDKCEPGEDDLLFRTSWDIVNANATLFIGGNDFVLSGLTENELIYGFRDTLVLPIGDKTFWEFPGIAQWVYKPVN